MTTISPDIIVIFRAILTLLLGNKFVLSQLSVCSLQMLEISLSAIILGYRQLSGNKTSEYTQISAEFATISRHTP